MCPLLFLHAPYALKAAVAVNVRRNGDQPPSQVPAVHANAVAVKRPQRPAAARRRAGKRYVTLLALRQQRAQGALPDDRNALPGEGIGEQIAAVVQQSKRDGLPAAREPYAQQLPAVVPRSAAKNSREQQIGHAHRAEQHAPRKLCKDHAARDAPERAAALTEQQHSSAESAGEQQRQQSQLERPPRAAEGEQRHPDERRSGQPRRARQNKPEHGVGRAEGSRAEEPQPRHSPSREPRRRQQQQIVRRTVHQRRKVPVDHHAGHPPPCRQHTTARTRKKDETGPSAQNVRTALFSILIIQETE